MVLGDESALEYFLLRSAEYPDIQALTLIDARGKVLASVRKDAQGGSSAEYGVSRLLPPHGEEPRSNLLETPAGRRLLLWQPVANGQVLGWLRLEIGLDLLADARRHIWQDSIVTALAAIIGSTTLLLLFLLRPLRALRQATDFASRLDVLRGQSPLPGRRRPQPFDHRAQPV